MWSKGTSVRALLHRQGQLATSLSSGVRTFGLAGDFVSAHVPKLLMQGFCTRHGVGPSPPLDLAPRDDDANGVFMVSEQVLRLGVNVAGSRHGRRGDVEEQRTRALRRVVIHCPDL